MAPITRATRALLFVSLALALAACGAMPTPVVRPTGRLEPTLARTRKPRPARTQSQTEAPQATEIFTLTPSDTPQPTLPATPTIQLALPFSTLTPTAFLLSPTPVRTPTVAIPLDCKLIWQSPPNGATYSTGEKFSVGWDIKNIGSASWEPGSFVFVYLDGTRLATHDDVIPLKESVPPGQEVVLSVPLKAPLNPNMYTTHWGIRQADQYFCRLTLTIVVQ